MTKRFIPVLFLFLGLSAWATGNPPQQLNITQFGGLNTESPEAALAPNETPDAENVVTDLGPGLRPRDGFVLCAASSATAQWVFPLSNGTRYQIVQSGGVLKADTGGCTFSVSISTVDATVNTAAAVLGDKFFFVNTIDGLKYWNGTSVTVASATLTAAQLVNHKSRLWASVLTADPRSVRASAFNDGTTWNLVTDPAVTDPALFVIGGAVDEPMTAIYASHLGSLIWMRPRSFGAITGDSRADFAVRTYSDNVGTNYPDSIRDCDGLLRWLGPSRTVYEWDGAKLENIGRNIQTYLGQIGQGDANSRVYTITTKTDYDSGTFYQKTSAITSGDIQLTTWTQTDTSTTNFNLGTLSNTYAVATDTNTPSTGRVYLTAIGNDSIENGTDFACPDGWTCGSGIAWKWSGIGYVGSHSFLIDASTPIYLYVQNQSGSDLINQASGLSCAPTSTTTWIQCSFSSSTIVSAGVSVGQLVKIGIIKGSNFGLSPLTVYSGNPISFYAIKNSNEPVIDLLSQGVTNGTFTSQAFDTALSSSAWLASDATDGVGASSITYKTQSSSDGVSWQGAVSWSTGSAPGSDFRRYIRYVVTLATAPSSISVPYIDAVTLTSRANYGAYISTPISLGTIGAFGLFNVNTETNGGTVAYAVYSDSNTAMTVTNGVPSAGFVSSQTITSGSYPSFSTAAYIRIGETETITIATNTPTNHSLALAWTEGNTLKVPSSWFRQRYWLGVAQNSTTNNKILIFDRNRQWQRYNGINASILGTYNGNLFFGNSLGVYQYESGNTDAGTAIASYYRTPTFSPSSANIASRFWDLRVTAENSSETLTTTYRTDGVATDYSFGTYAMNTKSGLQNFKLPFPITQLNKGRNVSLNLAVSGTTTWRILGMTLNFTPDRIPLD